jgi:excisionase family DNA binding protein
MEELDLNGWLTTEEAAKRAGFNKTWIVRLLGDGRLRGQKINGKAWIVSAKDLDRYCKNPPSVGRPRRHSAQPAPSAKPRPSAKVPQKRTASK